MTSSDQASKDSSSVQQPGDSNSANETITQGATDQFVPGMELTKASAQYIFGRYRIIKSLGQGAMGVVYLAQDTQLRRLVALKFPKISGPRTKDQLERFYREARSAAGLSHGNICTVYDVGQLGGDHFLAMAYVEGVTLAERARHKPLSQRESACVVRKIAQALLVAHKQHVIHRDLKPSNIMLDSRDEPIVMDFGLAHQSDTEDARLTVSGAILGTPAYMSPEQIEGNKNLIGPATDIYSLGVILYELISGKKPFTGSVASVLARVLTAEPPRISELRNDIDPQLEHVCSRMMSKRVEDRFQSMADVAAALNGFLEPAAELPISSGPRLEIESRGPQCYEEGATIDGQYLVERSIRGGMSTVYIVRDNVTEKKYALKSLEDIEGRSNSDSLSARFEREAAVWVNLDHHDNIVQAHTLLKRGGSPMLLLEYVPGPSLREVLAIHGALSVRQAVKNAMQFCAGMHYIHMRQLPGGQKGILHRDIKPENIMFDHQCRLKVTDFGLARLRDGRLDSISGEFLGTVAYSSPEQLQDSKNIDRRAEIFSFGVVFYEMLTGHHPFSFETVAEAIQSIQFREPDWDQVPAILRRTLQRCLEKSREPRFESFAELGHALEHFEDRLADESEPACPSCGFIGARFPSCVICNAVVNKSVNKATGTGRTRITTPISRRCQCGAVWGPGAAFCRSCGSRNPLLQCRVCDMWNQSENAFCNQCGTSLTKATDL